MKKISTILTQFLIFHSNMDAKKQIMSCSSVNMSNFFALGGSGTAGLRLSGWMPYHLAKSTGDVRQRNNELI